MKKPLLLILIFTLIKGIIWAGIIPFFQTPDEPLHFSHVQYLAENLKFKPGNNNASLELEKALRLLEFENIVFKPNKKPSYTEYFYGKYEDNINRNNYQERKILSSVINNHSQSPPLYYYFGSIIYRLSFFASILNRVYFLRLFSVICLIISLYVMFRIMSFVKFLPNNNDCFLPLLISLLPMLSFITASINNDNLFILLTTIYIYFLAKSGHISLNTKDSVLFGVISGFAFLTKQSFIPLFFFAIFILPFHAFLIEKKIQIKQAFIYVISFIIVIFPYLITQPELGKLLYKTPINFITGRSQYEDQKEYLAKYGIREIKKISYLEYMNKFIHFRQPQKLFNYFWGTFGWVDTRLPRFVYYLLFLFCLIASFGYLKFLWTIKANWKSNLWVIELTALVIFFVFSLSYYEWRYFQVYEDFFLQGRYLFPLIFPIMLILTTGWQTLFPKTIRNKASFFLIMLFMLFNFYCLFCIIIPRYYHADNLILLVKELSQYKPAYLKGLVWPFLGIIYLFSTGQIISKLYQRLWIAEEK